MAAVDDGRDVPPGRNAACERDRRDTALVLALRLVPADTLSISLRKMLSFHRRSNVDGGNLARENFIDKDRTVTDNSNDDTKDLIRHIFIECWVGKRRVLV